MKKNRRILSSILISVLIHSQVSAKGITNVSSKTKDNQATGSIKHDIHTGSSIVDNRTTFDSKSKNKNFSLLVTVLATSFAIAGVGAGIYYFSNNNKKDDKKEKFAEDKRLAPYFKQARLDTADKEILDYLFDEMKKSEKLLGEHSEDFVLPYTLFRIFDLSSIFGFVDSDSNGNSKPKRFGVDVIYSPPEDGNKQNVISTFSISDLNVDAIDDSFRKIENYEKYAAVYYSSIKNDLKPDNWENLCNNVYISLSNEFRNEKILKLLSLIDHFKFTFENANNKKTLKCQIADGDLINTFDITN